MPNSKTQKGHAKAEPSRANSREDNDNPGVMPQGKTRRNQGQVKDQTRQMKRDVLQCESTSTAEKNERVSTKSRQSGQKAPHHDAKRREPKTKRGEPKKPKEGEQPRVVYKVRDRVRSRKRRARAIVRRAHSALPLTRQRERSRVMSETACPMLSGVLPASLVRRSTTCLVNRPCVSNPSGTKSFPRSCAFSLSLFLSFSLSNENIY